LIVPILEYVNGKLVVDEMVYDPELPNHVIIRIGGEWFKINTYTRMNQEIVNLQEKDLQPYRKKIGEDWYRPAGAWQYWICGLIPRGGYPVELGRPITAQEWDELVAEYGLTEDDISPVFADTKGSIYGKQAERTFPARQIRLKTPANAIELEQRLRDRGIEVASTFPDRLSIRVEPSGE
jgi:hypothetical protein